ncbi:MAG TPA: M48 family metalloprotease [Gaiellaceae bacterium]|nr:M48 family metalloprotease [Gaiellaceae bacterium]
MAAVVWVVLAWLLWRTTVPSSLRLPHLNEQALFGSRLVHDSRRFERLLDWLWVLATLATLGAYAVMARRGRMLGPQLGLGPVNGGIILGLVTFTVVWAVGLPFALVDNWWERRHGISHQSYGAVLAAAWGSLLGMTLVVFVALAIVLGLARRFARMWWLPAGLAVAAILFALQFAEPFLATLGTHPVSSRQLAGSIHTLERREHAGDPVVRVQDVSGTTRAANAFSIGIGPTKTVVIWNTMLDGRFTPGEVRFVIGHELGHVVRNHVARGVGWFALLVLPVLLVTSLLVDVRQAGKVPLALLVIFVATLLLLPLRNAISRRYEAEADWIALNGTRDPAAAPGLFRGFVATSLEDPSPPGWVHVLLDDHPTPLQRIEMAHAWKSRFEP